MPQRYSLRELAERANAWCLQHGIAPASEQAAEAISERNIRFYRTLGLVDAPAAGAGGYGEKHFRQLVALRLLQAQGVPLRKIRELLYGRSLAELREICRRGLPEAKASAAALRASPAAGGELWRMIPLDDDFLLVSRSGAPITPAQREAVLRALRQDQTHPHPTSQA